MMASADGDTPKYPSRKSKRVLLYRKSLVKSLLSLRVYQVLTASSSMYIAYNRHMFYRDL
jgi:hypothetical protein